MGFKHVIDTVVYDVAYYKLDSEGHVSDWAVYVGLQEMPYDHLAPIIVRELERECVRDAIADDKINRQDAAINRVHDYALEA